MIVIRTLVYATTLPTENEELLLLGTPVELRVNVRADAPLLEILRLLPTSLELPVKVREPIDVALRTIVTR